MYIATNVFGTEKKAADSVRFIVKEILFKIETGTARCKGLTFHY